jgi:predicted GNAT family N-acyltransferase
MCTKEHTPFPYPFLSFPVPVMPTLSIFTADSLPEAHAQQIRDFVRLHWHDEYLYDIDAPLVPAARHPFHVVVHERHALLSHARVIWLDVSHGGVTYRMYCIGDVLTYPAFRRRGHGNDVVKAATGLVRDDPQADAAILFCDPANAAFYARHGWEPMPEIQAVYGLPVAAVEAQGLPMMLFCSERAQTARASFAEGKLELPGFGW